MTAVWWEQIPGTHLNCGLPQIYCNDTEGRPLENQQLDPDIEIYNTPEQMLSGDDAQLRRAIDHLLGK
jgi:C-terminal processing protease CtpA/Prc